MDTRIEQTGGGGGRFADMVRRAVAVTDKHRPPTYTVHYVVPGMEYDWKYEHCTPVQPGQDIISVDGGVIRLRFMRENGMSTELVGVAWADVSEEEE